MTKQPSYQELRALWAERGRCSKTVYGSSEFRGSQCNRPGAETIDGKLLCSLHAAGEKRSRAMTKEQAKRYEAEDKERTERRGARERLATLLGLEWRVFADVGTGLDWPAIETAIHAAIVAARDGAVGEGG